MRRVKEVKGKSGKKTVSRICSYLLIASMIVGGLTLSPFTTVEVQAAPDTKNVNLNVDNSIAGIDNPTSGASGATTWTGTNVYYGDKPYYVLDKNGGLNGHSSKDGNLLLLSKGVFFNGNRIFDGDGISDWKTSDIRTDLNHKDTNNGFYDTEFTATEQGAISSTTINNDNTDRGGYSTYPSGETSDKIFLLDLGDVENEDYGFSEYGGTRVADPNCSRNWWLRSPGFNDYYEAFVEDIGDVIRDGESPVYTGSSARPAFNLNLESVLFSSAIEEGKTKPDSFASTLGGSEVSSWKLTLKGSDSISPTKTSGNTILPPGYTAEEQEPLVISHVKASNVLNDATQVSVMLTDSDGTVLHYGKINDAEATSSNVAIPAGLSEGNYKLYVFAEEVNDNTETDYASDLGTPIAITVGNPPPVPHNDDSDNSPDDDSNSDSSSSTGGEAYVNPLVWSYAANKTESLCHIEQQGPLCVAAFNAATPKGYKEVFSFNTLLKDNGIFKTSYIKKTGKLVLNIPKEYQKKGRTFLLIGIDKFGNTKTFSDMDLSDEAFTTKLDIEGYAFSFIYTDIQ